MYLKNFKLFFCAAILLVAGFISSASGQCTSPNGPTPRPSFFNILLAIDQSYIDYHNGNVALARSKAQMQLDEALIESPTANSLNNTTRPLRITYGMHFKNIIFPNLVAPPKQLNDFSSWAFNIRQTYIQTFPCVPFDGVVLFTAELGTGRDVGVNGVAFFGTGGNAPDVIAHEIGHIIGLSHIIDPGTGACCNGNLATDNFMCPNGGNFIGLSGVTGCGHGPVTLNEDVFTSFNCQRWADMQPQFAPDHVCPVTFQVQFKLI